jgi:subtilisin family serine protease
MTPPSRRRIVVIDSGVDPQHPLVRGRALCVDGGTFGPAGCTAGTALEDQLGHGTAVAATILQFAAGPESGVELVSVRIFERHPICDFEAVLPALRHALSLSPGLVNLSLGTTSLRHRTALEQCLALAAPQGTRIVAPATYGGLPCDPGMLAGIEAVVADPNVLPMLPELRPHAGRLLWFASPLPPKDPDGVRRLVARGDSLAVAAVSGCLLQRSR